MIAIIVWLFAVGAFGKKLATDELKLGLEHYLRQTR